ncbi:MAG: HAMP domain-containing sensor histidine kinase [Chthoniobacterales bacterium]
MFRSLRTTLILPWLLIAVVCCALTFQLRGLFELGIGGEIGKVDQSVKLSAEQIKQELDLYLTGFSEAPVNFADSERQHELLLLLDLVLGRFYGIEGGFWSPSSRFIAYSFPTHDSVKRDVPQDEMDRITTVNERALSSRKEETTRFDSAGEVLLIHAIPVRSDLVIWTMGRAHVAAAAAFQRLTAGFVLLLLLMLATGALILWYLHRWGRQLRQIEEKLGQFDSKLPETGLKELDRLIDAFNQQTEKLREAQRVSNELSTELARAERLTALGRMSVGLAHEIRNPIGAMRLQAENALSKDAVDAYQKACRGMLQNIARLDDLFERLLAIVRLDRLTPKSIRIQSWLEDCVTPFRNAAAEPAIEVEAADTEWSFDEQQLARALHNLVANAVRHAPPNGRVKVTAAIENGWLGISVEDSGPGVPDELKEKIFEPFVSSRSEGSGLGLAIAREIVEAHAGTLRCVNGRKGARFEIRLPRREP